MKILILLGGLGFEGISNVVIGYLEELKLNNATIFLGVGGPINSIMLNKAKKTGVTVIQFPNRKHDSKHYYLQLYKFIKDEKIDIVHIHGNSATMALDLLVAQFAGCPIRLPHCHNTYCEHPFLNKLLKPFLYLTMTEGFACGVEAGKYLYGNREFKIIKNGRKVNKYLFDPNLRKQYRLLLGLSDEDKAIGHVGTFSYQKNQEFLIEAFSKIEDDSYKLFLFGEGEYKNFCEKQVNRLGLENRVKFMGIKENINEILNAMDVMTLPSRFEGLPLVVIEWQINRLPCVISDKVTSECKLMRNVFMISIENNNYIKWADTIKLAANIGRKCISNEEVVKKITEAGYNITSNAYELEYEYKMLYAAMRP